MAVAFSVLFFLVDDLGARGNPGSHTLVESLCSALALVIGAIALIGYYSLRDVTSLFVGVAFVGAGALDAYHAVVTTPEFAEHVASSNVSLIPWSWVASRLFLALMLWMAVVAWRRGWTLRRNTRFDETHVYAIGAAVAFGCFAFFAFVPLPPAHYADLPIHRPQELVPALFFLLALIGYLRKGEWRADASEHWIVLSILAAVFVQVGLMPFSTDIFDPTFEAGHYAKLASYLCMFIAALTRIYQTFRSAQEGHQRFRRAMENVQEGFALFDADDRLVAVNDVYRRLHAGFEDAIRIGARYEDMLRTAVARGRVAAAIGREEAFIEERLERHRNPSEPILRELTDGTWYRIRESRTPDGGIVVVETDLSELKRFEADLAESSSLLQGTIDAMAALVSVWDRSMRLLTWNKGFEEQFGQAGPLRVGMEVREIFLNNARRGDYGPGDPEELAEERYRRTLDVGWNEPVEIRVGDRVFEMARYELPRIGHVTVHRDVSERQRLESDLAEKSTLLHSTFDAMEDGLSIWSADDRLLAFNEKFSELMGGPGDRPTVGISVYELFLLNARNGLYGSGEPDALAQVRYERAMAADAETAQFITFQGHGSFEVLRNWMPDGSRVTIHRNVTDRVIAEERLAHIVEHLDESFVLWDPEGRLVLANQRFRELNAPIADVIEPGRSYEDYIRALAASGLVTASAADPEGWIAGRLADQRNPGTVQEVERQENQWFLVHKQRLPDGSVASIGTDITKIKLAEVRVREREQRLKTIVDNVVDGIVTFDKRGIMLSANPAAARIFRCPVDELLDRQFCELLVVDEQEGPTALSKIVGQSFETKGEIREFTGCRWGGEEFPMEAAVTEVFAGPETFYVCILRDISVRREMDRMKNEFVSTVSHELRTPLTSIHGSLGLVAAGMAGELPEQATELVEIAERNANRLIGLVNDILDMEKIESGRMDYLFQETPLSEVVAQAIDDNEGYADEFAVTFEIVDRSDGASVRIDPVRMAQVMANLLSNAAKFSPADGTVRIELDIVGLKVRVSVSDNGPGIPDEYKTRIFDKFTQVDSSDTRKVGGTGLGLSITRAIVERHGGEIDLRSETGNGTTFWFELPLIDQPNAKKTEKLEGTASVLVCEDDPDVSRLMEMTLRNSGFHVVVARSAGDAKRILNEDDFDAMTVDLNLPDQNGIEMIRELREHGLGDLPIVIVSAAADDAREKVRAGCLPIANWLKKPVEEGQLAAAIAEAIRSSNGAAVRILHVEDDGDLTQVITRLVPSGTELVPAATLREARRLLKNRSYDLVILDIGLPDGSGLDLLPELKSNGHAATPVLLLSGQEMEEAVTAETDAALVKSRTSNEELLDLIQSLIDR